MYKHWKLSIHLTTPSVHDHIIWSDRLFSNYQKYGQSHHSLRHEYDCMRLWFLHVQSGTDQKERWKETVQDSFLRQPHAAGVSTSMKVRSVQTQTRTWHHPKKWQDLWPANLWSAQSGYIWVIYQRTKHHFKPVLTQRGQHVQKKHQILEDSRRL